MVPFPVLSPTSFSLAYAFLRSNQPNLQASCIRVYRTGVCKKALHVYVCIGLVYAKRKSQSGQKLDDYILLDLHVFPFVVCAETDGGLDRGIEIGTDDERGQEVVREIGGTIGREVVRGIEAKGVERGNEAATIPTERGRDITERQFCLTRQDRLRLEVRRCLFLTVYEEI